MTTLRFKMVEEAIGRKAVEVKAPAERPAEYFGKYVFDRDKMRKYLPKACFETLMNTMKIISASPPTSSRAIQSQLTAASMPKAIPAEYAIIRR